MLLDGRRLLLGLGLAVLLVALSLALDAFAAVGDWQSTAFILLCLAILVFLILTVRPGTLLPGSSDPHEFHMEVIVPVEMQRGTSNHRPDLAKLAWLWPALPLFAAIVLLAFLP
jgi:hypothetical protein